MSNTRTVPAEPTYWVCYWPDGALYSPSLKDDREASLLAAFGRSKTHRQESLNKGWRCVEMRLVPAAAPPPDDRGARALALLRREEWNSANAFWQRPACPTCGGLKPMKGVLGPCDVGHKSDCERAAIIAEPADGQ